MAAALNQSELRAYTESANFNGRDAWRVRIGPFDTRAEAEAARLRALHVSDKVKASVVVLNAGDTPAAAVAAATRPDAEPAPVASATPPQPRNPPAEVPAAAPKPAPPAKAPEVAARTEPAPQPAAKPAAPAPVPKPAPKPATANVGFAVQLGAFADADAARALRDRARAAGLSAFTETVNTDAGPRTRVRIGPVADRADAEKLRDQAQSRLGIGGMVRPHP